MKLRKDIMIIFIISIVALIFAFFGINGFYSQSLREKSGKSDKLKEIIAIKDAKTNNSQELLLDRHNEMRKVSVAKNNQEKEPVDSNVTRETVIMSKKPQAIPSQGETLEMDTLIEELSPFNTLQNMHLVSILMSPKDCNLPSLVSDGNSLNAEVLKLFEKHNTIQDKISRVTLDGESLWGGQNSEAWQLHLEYDRSNASGSVQAREERTVLKGETLLTYDEDGFGSMQANALHLLMFRKFDPKKFYSVENADLVRQGRDEKSLSIPVKVLRSDNEILRFETQTGHLLQAEFLLGNDVLTVDMSNFIVIDESREIELPTVIKIKLPDKFFSVPLRTEFGRVIQMTIDPEQIQIE